MNGGGVSGGMASALNQKRAFSMWRDVAHFQDPLSEVIHRPWHLKPCGALREVSKADAEAVFQYFCCGIKRQRRLLRESAQKLTPAHQAELLAQ
ncbi:MAG: hypothetical protein R2911_26390 [Caldilineaceae bacterium]